MSKATSGKLKPDGKGADAVAEPKTAYISASGSIDTDFIRSALERSGIRAFSPDELDLRGQNLSYILREAMRQADIVVGVVDATPGSTSVFYELGFAQGLGKPTVVLLSGNVSPAPWNASGIPYFRFDPAKPSGVEFGISQVLKVPHHGTAEPAAPARRTKPLGEHADRLLVRLRASMDTINEVELLGIIEEAVRASGVTTVSHGSAKDKHVDLAVWSDDLSPWVGNPLPIELRRTVRGMADFQAAAATLSPAMTAGSTWGLLIYLNIEGHAARAATVPHVLSISAEEFLEALRTTSFGDLILRMRNNRVHRGI